MQKIVVITGCLGLIGSHLTKKCLDLGWYVYGIDKCTYAANLNFKKQFLKNMSVALNGYYKRVSYRDNDIDEIVAYINSFEKEQLENKRMSLYESQYPWFLGITWVLLALEWIL